MGLRTQTDDDLAERTCAYDVLVLDDEAALRSLVGRLLQRYDENYSYRAVETVPEAHEALADRVPDAIIADWSASRSFYTAVRAEYADVGFVYYSGRPENTIDFPDGFAGDERAGFLEKPWSGVEELAGAVRGVVED